MQIFLLAQSFYWSLAQGFRHRIPRSTAYLHEIFSFSQPELTIARVIFDYNQVSEGQCRSREVRRSMTIKLNDL